MTYDQWATTHPQAAAELAALLVAGSGPASGASPTDNEAKVQAAARLSIAQQGALSWRNNVGATPAKCPKCNAPGQPVRYGLANDSTKLNKFIKSSDLILLIPRLITADMVGSRIGQFGAVEMKAPGWTYKGKGREVAQAAWLSLVAAHGGYSSFSTGDIKL